MSIVQFDSQKIEQLLNSATSERQRKMYQALLDKARSQERSSTKNKRPEATPSTEKTAQTKPKSSTKTQKKTKTVKKNQKVATQSTSIEASTTTKQSPQTLTESSPLPPTSATPEPASSTIEPAPQTEPKPQSKKSESQQPATKPPIFQALGTMIATPYFQDKRSYIKINGDEYNLLPVGGKHYQSYMKLKEELGKNGSSPMFLRVYPKATFDYKTSQPRLAFSLVNFSHNCEKINEQPQGFMLRGIWQYIPHSKTPVITIYRNHEQKVHFKNLSKSQQLSFAQPLHIPVVWDAPVEPFKFNPQAEKDSQMPRYFVEVRAIFKDGLYVVEEMLREPTRKLPKFIKVSKKEQLKSVEQADAQAQSSATT